MLCSFAASKATFCDGLKFPWRLYVQHVRISDSFRNRWLQGRSTGAGKRHLAFSMLLNPSSQGLARLAATQVGESQSTKRTCRTTLQRLLLISTRRQISCLMKRITNRCCKSFQAGLTATISFQHQMYGKSITFQSSL